MSDGSIELNGEDAAAQIAALTRLADHALGHWPGDFSGVRLIKLRENAVFEVIRDDGRRFALRVHRHGYHSPAALRSELAWQRALSMAGIPVPSVIPAADGDNLVEVSHPALAGTRHVDLLGWLAGTPIGTAEHGVAVSGQAVVALVEKLGAFAAAMHDHAAAWDGVAAVTRHDWDADGLVGDAPLWGRFWEMPDLAAEDVDLLLRARDRAARDLERFGRGADRYGLIHADLVPDNVLVDGERLAIIDFDDCGFGWHMFDLATALFFLGHQPNFPALRDALFAGYRTVRALPPEHEALLPLFLFLRGSTYLGWIQTRSDTPAAREMAPAMIERVMAAARGYLETGLVDHARKGTIAVGGAEAGPRS